MRSIETDLTMMETELYRQIYETLAKYEFNGFSAHAWAEIIAHKTSEECREWIYACEELRSKAQMNDP